MQQASCFSSQTSCGISAGTGQNSMFPRQGFPLKQASLQYYPEMPTLEGPNAGGLPSLEGPNAGGKIKMLEVYIACYNFL